MRFRGSRSPEPRSPRPARRASGAMRSGGMAAGREDGRLRITFHGAARQVTGSAHLLEIGRHRILLDCGLFDSEPDRPATARTARFTFEPRDLDAVIVSHAHNDHIGRLPCLVRAGYRGPIYATAGHRRHHQRDAPRQRPDPARGRCATPTLKQRRRRADRAAVRAGRRRVGRRAAPPAPLRRADRDPAGGHPDLPRRRPHPRLGDGPARLRGGRPRPPVRLHRRPRPPQHGPPARPDGRQGHRHPGHREHLRQPRARPLRQADQAAPRDRRPGDPAPEQGRDPGLQPGPDPADGLLPPGAVRRPQGPADPGLRRQPAGACG